LVDHVIRVFMEMRASRSYQATDERVPALVLRVCLAVSLVLFAGTFSVPAIAAEASPRVFLAQAGELKFKSWNFDQDKTGGAPAGFSAASVNGGPAGGWRIQADAQAPTPPNTVVHQAGCEKAECMETLLLDETTYEFPDLMVRFRLTAEGAAGEAGLVLGAKDPRNFYAVLVNPEARTLAVVQVVNGKLEVIRQETIKKILPRFFGQPAPGPQGKDAWHVLRVQHNTILSKSFIEAFFDNELVISVREDRVGAGKIGLITKGKAVTAFDSLHVFQMFSNRPLSSPAPYTD
jgi:hypothetical protein